LSHFQAKVFGFGSQGYPDIGDAVHGEGGSCTRERESKREGERSRERVREGEIDRARGRERERERECVCVCERASILQCR